MGRVAQIWRHPIKGIGAEPLDRVDAAVDRPLPGDRAFAVLTGSAEDTGAWQPCRNFMRGCYGPELMAIGAESGADGITLRHPKRPEITVDPRKDGAELINWLRPLWPEEQKAPKALVAAPTEGMADASYASVAILGLASLDALSEACGMALDPRRFRGNVWLSGLEPFEELDWAGRRLRLGTAELEVVERIDRCRATEANPETGERDARTLLALRKGWGHLAFGVKARVVTAGKIALDDEAVLL